jgi:hypothetical protein
MMFSSFKKCCPSDFFNCIGSGEITVFSSLKQGCQPFR